MGEASLSCRFLSATLLLLLSAIEVAAAEGVSFSREVQPILAKHCFACHGPDAAESGLALHLRDTAFAISDSGERAIVPHQPTQSELVRRVGSNEDWERMPPEGDALSEKDIDTLRRWIADGAGYEKHWAFVPPQRVALPEVPSPEWAANPIDRFVLAKLLDQGLSPSAPADKRTLARRVYFDITGLPPTPEELQAYLADTRPDAYERLIDKLLASPRYGEKWARHWLDVVRYAETNSFERDDPKPYAWKYRDYVIRSLNEDKPYDQFVREQLAGDELDEVTTDSVIATGYYRLGTWDDEPADPLQAKYDDLDSIVSTTGQAFLGLTVGCARCHDHKIDPMPQTDYYSMLSFFADVTTYGERSVGAERNSLWDLSGPQYAKERQRLEHRRRGVVREKHEFEQAAIAKMSAPDQTATETHERQSVLDEKLHKFVTPEEYQRYKEMLQRIERLGEQLAELPPAEWALSLARCEPNPDTTHVMMRGNPNVPGDPIEPSFPELFGDQPPSIPQPKAGARSSGRRRVLAEWITRPDNLLTSRVIANRVWQHHFGRGIVRSASNFGRLGAPPTHPELLDWLATWLVDQDWRLKPLHRLILTSNTYRMASTAPYSQVSEGLAVDPMNDLLWRFDMRRLTAEEIRDTSLFVSGQLNLAMYGPSIYPKLSDEVHATQSRPGKGWPTSGPRDAARRSIYIHIKRSLVPPALANFDFPETDTSCEARFNTTQAAQALNLMHGHFLQEQATHLAERVRSEAGDVLTDQVGHVMRLALQRDPDDASVADGLALIDLYRNKHGLSEDESLRQYCLMVLNLNEFVYLD